MATHLVAISSPLQLINAMEALSHHRLQPEDCQLIVRAVAGTQNDKVIRELLNEASWASIYWYDSKSKFLMLPKLLHHFKGSHWQVVVGGELTPWWLNTLYANIEMESLVLVDDGVMTLADHDKYLSKGRLPEKTKGFKDKVLGLLGFNTMSFEIESPLELFTIFDLESTQYCSVSKNEMRVLRQQLAERQAFADDGDIVFVGQPLVGIGMVTWKTVKQHLLAVRSQSPTGRVIYCTHRNEDAEDISRIRELDGFEVVTFPCPIEIGLSRLEQPISMLVGFCSTALFTLNQFYQELPIKFVEFESDEYLTEEYRRNAGNIYQNLAQSIPKLEQAEPRAMNTAYP
tara:strand:- start:8260 stop:9291 length:1032 start_codon:yes stop_codon:yes gene_type:complete